MKRTRINPISKKRAVEHIGEFAIRKQLCERAGGFWNGFFCVGGKCEEEKCGKPADWRGLHPHEKKFRSQGGKLSLKNSLMLCGRCHNKEHGIKEK